MPAPARCRAARILPIALAALLLPAAGAARGAEYYFLLIFGSQNNLRFPVDTHTWATFVRAVGDGPDISQYQLYLHTISWMPANLRIRALAREPEPGVNLTLEQTLAYVLGEGEHVRLWGPFQILDITYNRSLEVYYLLNSGAVQYRAASREDDPLVNNCIHAVARVDTLFGRSREPLVRAGHPASRHMARVAMSVTRDRGLDQRAVDTSWLIPRLGLDRYPITVVPPCRIPHHDCVLCALPD
jgi:hypothetical protein